ncbi:MAG: TRAP transporter large permease subunit, partial [Pyramidobacter sp.]|nr:TRAP transporter large permease subunit [Pyramidobacter sp.]
MTNFLLVVAILLFILAMGMPVAFGLGCTSLILIHMFHLPVRLVGTTMWASLESFNTLSIPIFVIMSQFLLDGHVGDDLFDVMNTWVRHLPGGLAIGTIFACAYFAAIT